MSFFSGSSDHTWQPTTTSDTTIQSYWLNWRFLLCSIWIMSSMALAFFLIRKHEGLQNPEHDESAEQDQHQLESPGIVYEDEAWNTCLIGIDPLWLFAYRIISFVVLLALIIANVARDGGGIFYFYTQWTFTLVTIYFGLASSFSFYGCFYRHKGDTVNHASLDAEQGIYMASSVDRSLAVPNLPKSPDFHQQPHARQIAGLWGYIFQIIYQTCAGAVVLTDSVFWFIIYPFLTSKDYSLDFLIFCMHSINAVFLLGDTSLNCMRFPMFRFAYFVLWTAIFVIFQWIVHACVSIWWPYPFLDLSSSNAPLWYLVVAMMHIPCFGIFALVVRLKHYWLSRSFPGSNRFVPW